jgi:hypothetical protein
MRSPKALSQAKFIKELQNESNKAIATSKLIELQNEITKSIVTSKVY